MKHLILTLATLLAAGTAHADGFLCQTDDGLDVKVFNHVSAIEGARTAAQMVISDDNIAFGNKTIATFSDAESALASYRQTYVANVDLRLKNRQGERIGATQLGEISQIVLSVDFNYADLRENDDTVNGRLTLVKRDGRELIDAVNCKRYLKQ